MKKTITLWVTLISLSIFSSCKDKNPETNKDEIPVNEVPASTQAAFNNKYTGATGITWEDAHESDMQTYKVKFTFDGKKMVAEFDANGVLIKQKEDD